MEQTPPFSALYFLTRKKEVFGAFFGRKTYFYKKIKIFFEKLLTNRRACDIITYCIIFLFFYGGILRFFAYVRIKTRKKPGKNSGGGGRFFDLSPLYAIL